MKKRNLLTIENIESMMIKRLGFLLKKLEGKNTIKKQLRYSNCFQINEKSLLIYKRNTKLIKIDLFIFLQ